MEKTSLSSVSMADIAKAAGVSESTVSRALRDSPLISHKTREKVQKIASAMNFKINESARNLRLKRSHTISVIINKEEGNQGQTFSDPFMIDLIGSIADELSLHNYDLLFSAATISRKDWHSYLLGSRRSDGIIVIGQSTDDSILRELQRSGDPLVVWGTHTAELPYCTVGSDNYQGGLLATQHLIDLGRQNIVFLGDIQHAEINARFQGYFDTLKKNQLETHERHLGTPFSTDSAYECVDKMLRESKVKFDGIFAASDNIAMGTIKALQKHGYNIPRDVSIVGFDDIPIAPFFTPPITTIRQNIHHGGKLLVKKILSLVNGEAPSSEVMPTELIIRGSCGANPEYTPLDNLA